MKRIFHDLGVISALALMAPETGTSTQEAPRILPDKTQAGGDTPSEAKAPAGDAESKNAEAGETKSKAKTAGKAAKAAPKAPPAPPKRESKIANEQVKVVAMLKKSSMTVQAMASRLEVTERVIRQCIDRARAHGEKINRVARNTFGYEKPRRT